MESSSNAMAELSTLDVLAIAAHPDDVELVMGGTLLKLAKLGYQTGILDVSRGEASTRGTPEIRASEAQEAASLLGCAVRINLGLADSRIFLDDESRTLLVRVLRELRPRVILTQHWEDPHPDHAHTAQLVREAAHISGLAKYDSGSGQTRFRPNAIAYSLFPRTVPPSFIVDISEYSERKWQAIRCHRSQFFDPQTNQPETRISTSQFLDEIEARDRYFGALIGVARGEPFLVREALNVADPVSLLSAKMNLYS